MYNDMVMQCDVATPLRIAVGMGTSVVLSAEFAVLALTVGGKECFANCTRGVH